MSCRQSLHGDPSCPNTAYSACPVGTLCGNGPLTWTCADLQTDAQHCSACGNVCQDGTTCQGGQCTCPAGELSIRIAARCAAVLDHLELGLDWTFLVVCPKTVLSGHDLLIFPRPHCVAGTDNCSVGSKGCTTDLLTDSQNCGACGNACGAKSCVAGTCACSAGKHLQGRSTVCMLKADLACMGVTIPLLLLLLQASTNATGSAFLRTSAAPMARAAPAIQVAGQAGSCLCHPG